MERRAEALGPTGERVRQQLRKLRLERELTLRELADKLQLLGRPIVLSSLSKIEKGQRRVDSDDLVALALALQVSPIEILLPGDLSYGDEVQLTPMHSLSVVDARAWASLDEPGTGSDTDLDQVAKVLDLANDLRTKVAALHSRMRLPHVGVSRAVPHQDLYVTPHILDDSSNAISPQSLTTVGAHTVIIGDPGAGKSTLLTKIAHDLAASSLPDHKAQVPLLLQVREFSESINRGSGGLVDYLKQTCQSPYNINPPRDTIEYLLRNSRAVILIDGLDELTKIEMRRKLVALIDVFMIQYPRVPILASSRRAGYFDAPLDSSIFTTAFIASLNEEQVQQYVHNWFNLDEGSSPSERDRLANSLLKESQDLGELRSNPLLLSLLCAMYSSDHYLPNNRAQVYERCAVMLFETWDSRRGIGLPIQFHGRLRGAVQYLGWRLLTISPSEAALPRQRIIQILSEYLISKLEDEDESEALAEDFLAYCTGRSWVISEIGIGSGGPLYAFTHKTFQEYFAAEYLVRRHRSADQLWASLESRVLSGEWDTVAQIVVQLYERHVESGGDELISIALSIQTRDKKSRKALNYFLFQVAQSNHLSPHVQRRIESEIQQRIE